LLLPFRLILAERRSAAVAWAFMLNAMLFANWFARIPAVQRDLDLGDGALGLILTGMPLGSALAMPVVSLATARFGAGRATVVAAGLCALAIVPPGLVTSGWQLFVAMVLLGFCNGTMDVAMNTEAAIVEARRGRSMMSGFHAMWSLGGFLGAGIGSLGAATVLPGLHLALVGGLGLVSVVLLRPLARVSEPLGDGGAVFTLPSRAILVLAGMAFAAFLAEGAVADWSGVYLVNEMGGPSWMAGAGYAVFAGGMTVGRLLGDGMIDRFGPSRMVAFGGLLASGGLGVVLLLAQPYVAIAGFVFVGFGLATIVPVLFRAAARTPGMAAGTSVAAVASTGYAGALAGPAVIGLAAEWLTLSGALAIPAGLALLVALNARRVRRRE